MNSSLLQVYEIDDGERWHYIAATAERALDLFISDNYHPKISAQNYRAEFPETIVSLCNPNTKLTIRFEDGEDHKETKTCAEWAAEATEEGLLCSSVY